MANCKLPFLNSNLRRLSLPVAAMPPGTGIPSSVRLTFSRAGEKHHFFTFTFLENRKMNCATVYAEGRSAERHGRPKTLDTLINIRTFLAVARSGSFSAAGRHLGVAPSVVTKRVSRLEDQMRVKLFIRSTRQIILTEVGERYLPRYQSLVKEIDDAISGAAAVAQRIEGHLRIKAPTTVTIAFLARILSDFQQENPNVTMDLALVDRSVNPAEEGYDIALGALPASYSNVIDEPLCPYPRKLCAAPDYLENRGLPKHPRDLVDHICLTFHATGSTWSFLSPGGPIDVEVRSAFSANDTQILHDLALRGRGVAMVANYVAEESIRSGKLIELLPDFPVAELWLKALIPQTQARKPTVRALMEWLRIHMHTALVIGDRAA
ncbi:Transcriptional regulator [Neorhizobium galegae bv. officinalis bv. officinalis str. HAMBI 1141]|uniref:HTH-type transcriptional regulator TtuA n=1 Tax=Neorhizobium galegae bv. officinalis bv. officinalis str. HAMBI 1141 TaxID=1028801 RepID=A0A068TB11_NEOGA|nr:Transcriptional regulator [Neorhizobium galegae bv. officinalis bv. officinalis str. HAMBI 1141]